MPPPSNSGLLAGHPPGYEEDATEAGVSLPCAGMVVCCTSLDAQARHELVEKSTELGARNVLDLTSDVTHLICAAATSPKYKYVAKMRADVKVLRPEWVHAMYHRWLAGDDVDPNAFAKDYAFPPFFGFRISVTGIPDVAERKRIEERCLANGASYHPDLTRQVTHLVAAAPTGKKYEFARTNKVMCVTPEWFEDSLERGMALDENCYDPTLPPDKIGVGAKPKPLKAPVEVAEVTTRRKIRKSTEARLGGQSQGLWDDIMSHASNPKPKPRDEWAEQNDQDQAAAEGVEEERQEAPTAMAVPRQEGLLTGKGFHIYGFEDSQRKTVRSVLVEFDGAVMSTLEDLIKLPFERKFIVVPRAKPAGELPPLDNTIDVVTEWWIETLLTRKEFVEPSEDSISTISIQQFPITGFDKLEIVITQFSSDEIPHWQKLIPMLGAKFADTLRKKSSVLITKGGIQGPKFKYAMIEDIPVVPGQWLFDCIKESRVIPWDSYRIHSKRKFNRVSKGPESSRESSSTKELLGDRFKRKASTEHATGAESASKRQRSQSAGPGGEDVTGKQPKKAASDGGSKGSTKSESSERKILDGCIICIGQSLKDRNAELVGLASELGATTVPTFDDTDPLTHLIHGAELEGEIDHVSELKTAGSILGCRIVSPGWLLECTRLQKRIDEKFFIVKRTLEPQLEEPDAASKQSPDHWSLPPPPPQFRQDTAPDRNTSALSEFSGSASTNRSAAGSASPHDAIPLGDRPSNVPTSRQASLGPSETSQKLCREVSQILSKFGPEELSDAINKKPQRRPRRRLQGKADPATVSRTPSYSLSASQQEPEVIPMPSQVVKYVDEDAEREKRRIRERLNPGRKESPPKEQRGAQAAVDLTTHTPVRRSARKAKERS